MALECPLLPQTLLLNGLPGPSSASAGVPAGSDAARAAAAPCTKGPGQRAEGAAGCPTPAYPQLTPELLDNLVSDLVDAPGPGLQEVCPPSGPDIVCAHPEKIQAVALPQCRVHVGRPPLFV